MKLQLSALVAACALISGSAFAVEPDSSTQGRDPDAKSVEIPFSKMTFVGTGVSAKGPLKPGDTTSPQIEIYDLYGKFGGGRHGTMMRFPVGFDTVLHTHTGDYYAVLIQGTMRNFRPGGQPVTMSEPGSFWYQTGGQPHITQCISKTPCVAFLVQSVGFDAQLLP
jgi:quercetin dioxygenase-like cupin family protein